MVLTETNEIKKAVTQYPVMDLIKVRWSARSFSEKNIQDDDLNTLIEAASWAPSANNEQPWKFLKAQRGTKEFEQVWNSLMPGNQPWAKNAAAFIVSICRTNFETTSKPNAYAQHDIGLANAFLILQARSQNIFCHPMAGFNKIPLMEAFAIGEGYDAFLVTALGYLEEASKLEEPYRTRETSPRTRKPIEQLLWKGITGN